MKESAQFARLLALMWNSITAPPLHGSLINQRQLPRCTVVSFAGQPTHKCSYGTNTEAHDSSTTHFHLTSEGGCWLNPILEMYICIYSVCFDGKCSSVTDRAWFWVACLSLGIVLWYYLFSSAVYSCLFGRECCLNQALWHRGKFWQSLNSRETFPAFISWLGLGRVRLGHFSASQHIMCPR